MKARGQGHSVQSIQPLVQAVQQRFPNQGVRDMRHTLRLEYKALVSE